MNSSLPQGNDKWFTWKIIFDDLLTFKDSREVDSSLSHEMLKNLIVLSG